MIRYAKSEQGMALPTVLMIMIVAFSFAAITLTYSTSQVKTEIIYENSTKALQAAEAGLHTYLWTLNKEKATIALGKIITYPETNPEYGYILEMIEDSTMKKKIKSTGWALNNPEIKQTMTATFSKKSYTAHVYFTNKENANIFWADGEVCYGSLRTNGNLYIKGEPLFLGTVYYTEEIYVDSNGVNTISNQKYNRIFKKGTKKEAALPLPQDNNELAILAKKDNMLYEGRTSIMMNENGKLTIWNAVTDKTEVKDIPDNGVIYVNSVGNSNTGTFDKKAGNVFISGTLKGRLTVGAVNNIYITDYDPTKKLFSECVTETNGVRYATTTFSDNLEDMSATGTDMLGLIANNNVEILTKGWFNSPTANSAVKDIYVHAAILAINGSFRNSNNVDTPVSTNYENKIILRGSLAQLNRGGVGSFPSKSGKNMIYKGYSKNYVYDPRLAYNTPPNFLEPKTTGWEIVEWN